MPTVTPAPVCSYLDDDFPTPRKFRPLLALLLDLGYSDAAIESVVTHANRFGSLECASRLDREHRETAEATLPDDPEWGNAEWDRFVYAPGPEVPR
jgi:hypothetical protein